MTMLSAAIFRFVAELACIVSVVCAAMLAYADKSAWVWGWFLIFAALNIVTGTTKVTEETKTSSAPRSSDEGRAAR